MEGFGGGHGVHDEDEWVAAVESQLSATPTHPFTPDVVAWARDWVTTWGAVPRYNDDPPHVKAARQIIAVVEGRG